MSSNSNSPPNLLVVDYPFLPYKPKKPNPYNKYTNYNILAFFSSLLILFLILSIFTIFKNLSFPSLFNSTIFWFFISNTLIFIIAADYYYYDSPLNPKKTPFQLQTSSLVEFDEEREDPDEKCKVVVQGCDFQPPVKTPARSYRRSKSEKPKRSVSKESKKMMVGRRSESVKSEEKEIEENEYSKMTDEELNRRVEEFIQRFNRQMRLQTRSTELKTLVFRE